MGAYPVLPYPYQLLPLTNSYQPLPPPAKRDNTNVSSCIKYNITRFRGYTNDYYTQLSRLAGGGRFIIRPQRAVGNGLFISHKVFLELMVLLRT